MRIIPELQGKQRKFACMKLLTTPLHLCLLDAGSAIPQISIIKQKNGNVEDTWN